MNKKQAQYQLAQWEIVNKRNLKRTSISFRTSTQLWNESYKTLPALLAAHPELIKRTYVTREPLSKPKRSTRKPNAIMLAYEKFHKVRFYGSQVKQLRDHWRCLSVDQRTYIIALSLDELVTKAPHCCKSTKPTKLPSLTHKPTHYVPRTKHQGKAKVLIEYETKHNVTFTGFRVRPRNNAWECLSHDKSETLTFATLELLHATCPFAASP